MGATGYVIDRGVLNPATGNYNYSQIATVGAGVISYVDSGAITSANSYNNHYKVAAIFPGGVASIFDDSSVSESSDIPLSNVYITANLVRNGSGRWQVMFSGLPTNSPQTVQLTWGEGYFPYLYSLTQTNLSTTNLTGGIFQLPDALALELQSYGSILPVTAQLFGPNGEPGQIVDAGLFPYDAPYFVDGRRHMKQNLNFLLRAAPMNQLFFSISNAASRFDGGSFNVSGTNFEEFSFLHHLGYSGDNGLYGTRFEDLYYFMIDDLWPFTANYELDNYLADATRTNGMPYGTTNFTFQPNFATNVPAPAILGLSDPYRILQPGLYGYLIGGRYACLPSAWGLSFNAQTNSASLNSGNNLFGLAYNSGYLISYTNHSIYTYQTLYPLGNITLPGGNTMDDYASWSSTPSLSLVNYYFAPLLPPENGFSDVSGLALPGEIDDGNGLVQPYPVPIQDDFNVTNQTPPIIASVGQPMVIGGWAKYSVGSSGKFAYLGQYFQTNALLLNTNGVVTTNTAGVMSPYGEFFPLQTGTAQFMTMPDIDNPSQQGTGVVKIVSMNVDANHDGVMDFSYSGPDQNSPSRPFRFWAADDDHYGDFGGNGNPGIDPFYLSDGSFSSGLEPAVNPRPNEPVFEAAYRVNGRRHLEDFFPVYLNLGSLFQTNAFGAGISATDTNWQFILTDADTALRFAYTDLTPTNYMNFLRDTNESGQLSSIHLVTVTARGVVLSNSFVASTVGNLGILLVEARTNTTQPLVLTVNHGTNRVAQMSLYLSIGGVEQMFRHKSLLLNPNISVLPDRLTDSSVPNEPDTIAKSFVFLHGYNVLPDEARGVASDVYKRLYWSGSHAKFYAVTWQGADTKGTPPFYNALTPDYHTNVVNAFLTAPNLANFIATLTNTGPVVVSAHSLGNMVTLSAISDWNAPISQYFMLDAAVPVEAIDPTATTNTMIYSTWTGYTNRLYASDWYQLFPANDARNTLSWNNRLGNLRNVDVYNFYSSGEEVLRTSTNDPPASVLNKLLTQATYNFWDGFPFGSFTWYWQEKGKGTCSQDWFLGSTHGGWQFSPVYNDPFGDHMSNSVASLLPSSELQTNSFFNFNSFDYIAHPDAALLGSGGSAYAQANRNRILSDAIPAMSLVAGANPITILNQPGQPHNIDMVTLENGWPQGRTVPENNKWHHSDFHEVAYTFTYHLFDQFVTTGNLK